MTDLTKLSLDELFKLLEPTDPRLWTRSVNSLWSELLRRYDEQQKRIEEMERGESEKCRKAMNVLLRSLLPKHKTENLPTWEEWSTAIDAALAKEKKDA